MICKKYNSNFNLVVIFVWLCIIFVTPKTVRGEDMMVKSFKLLPSDRTAVQSKTRKQDHAGRTAALIKILTNLNANQIDFENRETGIVAKERKSGQIWLYIPAHTRSLVITHKNFNTLNYYFEEEIQAGKTYLMNIKGEGKEFYLVSDLEHSLIYVNGDSIGKSPLFVELSYGEHEIMARKGLMLFRETLNLTKKSYTRIELPMHEIPIKDVNDYVALYLPDFRTYIKEHTDLIDIPTKEGIRQAIEKDIMEWQTKGEFESTSDWKKRVNDNTRQDRIDSLTTTWKNKSREISNLYNKAILDLQLQYKDARKHYVEDYYAYKMEQALVKCRESYVSMDFPYDADNQVFLINSSLFGDILLNVPIDEAPSFKKNWPLISENIIYEFLPSDESNVALSKIVFSNNGRKYIYDGQSEVMYAITDVNYDFNPIEIGEIDFDINSLPELSETNSVPTLNTISVSGRKVDVKINSVNITTKDENREIADVDNNIPKGNIERANTFALILANENYRRVSGVSYALNDGYIIKEYFNRTLGLPEKNILFVQDASLNDIKYNIKRLQDICGVFKGDASVIVYYAGHGVPDGKSLDAYLLPIDGYADDTETGVSLSEFCNTLAALPSKQTTLFIDACFSGTGREGGMLSEARGVKLRPKETDVKGNLIVFSASQGVETAHPYDEKSHGIFTYYFIKKLNETQGKVKLGELADYIINNVSRTTALDGNMQTPTIKTSLKDWKDLEL